MTVQQVITYYLEMRSPDALKEAPNSHGLNVLEAKIKQYQVNRFLYAFVGQDWQWRDKTSLTDDKWKAYAEDGRLRTWIACMRGSIAGYYELQRQAQGDVEVTHLGLAPGFIGKGLGAYLVSHAVRSAWQWKGTRRLWLHTCSLDHPAALHNYLARGFVMFRKECRDRPLSSKGEPRAR